MAIGKTSVCHMKYLFIQKLTSIKWWKVINEAKNITVKQKIQLIDTIYTN